ncbi:MAG: recombination mediator RecR [Planctomycetaceae bacterium]
MALREPKFRPHPYGPAVTELIEQFSALPGIGSKSAERLAYHVVTEASEEALKLAEAIRRVKTSVRPCSICYNWTEEETCSICNDHTRDKQLICVVEQPKDLLSLEASGAFQGVYHVLLGRISPLEGIGPDDLTIAPLLRRIRQDHVRELVMATNPTLEGDGTSLFISNCLADDSVKITRLARGIATGSVLEFANKAMLADALKGRQHF